jgi:hypothetical protein
LAYLPRFDVGTTYYADHRGPAWHPPLAMVQTSVGYLSVGSVVVTTTAPRNAIIDTSEAATNAQAGAFRRTVAFYTKRS